ncbi:hypothetical protein PF005_g14716 [Phytophthora fragariae]|uniref:Thioesterase domain-containing protein n=1 Tax=Phytophthora fragariae TaxID=53985 RepID=A0A6A3EN96_9STRA|nr:hypothetical protein PF003_g25234 [Phytophthora fragariae]KAE8934013.1 hypothetical protein PF009_g15997 [Phytophthora fragariae]KAE9001499.1 hypothetical protein PF011_g13717 [Phytophthora fragariae]KAE9101493.1 hypothetical protein PF007_g15127 [Phytophthora fragariae]KAE9101690.1 hypothetical protein PF010_g14369 [Phytophthora fragariae]
MVLRAFWNIGAGLVHRLVSKRSMGKGVLGVSYPSVWKGRTGLLDCDVNLHLNNSSYLYSMELARWHFCAANGILWQAIKNRRMIVVGSQTIRYRHAIPPFHAYEIKTKVVYWDDDWIYLLYQFQDPATGKQFAEGLVRGVVMKGRRRVSANRVFAEVSGGEMIEAPKEVPGVVKGFLDWDGACTASMRDATKKAELQLETNPPPPTPEKIGARMWQEMKKSMNLP